MEAALFARVTGVRQQTAEPGVPNTLSLGWKEFWPVLFWCEPGMQCSSKNLEPAHSGSNAASSPPGLIRVTESSIQTKI